MTTRAIKRFVEIANEHGIETFNGSLSNGREVCGISEIHIFEDSGLVGLCHNEGSTFVSAEDITAFNF